MKLPRKIRYSNDEISIIWQPHKCTHTFVCVSGLPKVFDINRKPWIVTDGIPTDVIINQVNKCTSGALTYELKNTTMNTNDQEIHVKVVANGPLLFKGTVEISLVTGEIKSFENPALCRCGGSANKPFCDGTHKRINFTD